MGPATIVGILPEEKGTSGTAKTYICRGGEKSVYLFFSYSNVQNIDDKQMMETF